MVIFIRDYFENAKIQFLSGKNVKKFVYSIRFVFRTYCSQKLPTTMMNDDLQTI